MNNVQQEQLFTDLTPAQAETTTGGSPTKFPSVFADYGVASASVERIGFNPNAFTVTNLRVKDILKDGHPVYAQIQGKPSDGSNILTSGGRHFDRKGAAGKGTVIPGFSFGFNPFEKHISKVRLVILRDNPGRDLFVAGSWVDI
ncbi:hypothetical protein HJG54_25145 [Leptolyngbya sp. NK1-12]|uniref:Uncharacterized protein n=1 Tax=Leptolyngbya sp. NK1-12 TaxID=2547451 RepID=A0AA96WX35_9CYAN|nr:hypothetical protein [Leptolyngbya sp. NK1-12]WNZ25797.1 hypothetical protein HJG54_25145 [Leptolyngbya sp. NK1-12]